MLDRVQDIVFEYLAGLNASKDAREPVLRSRVSSAGRCARAIGLQVANLAPSNPPDGYSMVNFFMGDAVHGLVQRAIVKRWPDATTEIEGMIGDFLAGHADVMYTAEDGGKVICEIKSIADFGFMKATGIALKSSGRWHKKDEEPEGPKREHLLQAAIYAIMLEAQYVSIVYVRKTATLGEPVTYEWRYPLADIYDAAQDEIERHKGIVSMVRDEHKLPEREFEGEIITNPKTVKWPCGYCGFRDACLALGEGIVEIK